MTAKTANFQLFSVEMKMRKKFKKEPCMPGIYAYIIYSGLRLLCRQLQAATMTDTTEVQVLA